MDPVETKKHFHVTLAELFVLLDATSGTLGLQGDLFKFSPQSRNAVVNDILSRMSKIDLHIKDYPTKEGD